MNHLEDILKARGGKVNLEPAKQQIYKELMELVGEDDTPKHNPKQLFKAARNELRAELRQAIAEWCGVK